MYKLQVLWAAQIMRLIKEADVIFTSCNNSGADMIQGAFNPNVICVDEAGQATVANTAESLVWKLPWKVCFLFGDPAQLKPFTLAGLMNEWRYFAQVSILGLFEQKGSPVTRIRKQYCMHLAIADFPNRKFYDSQIENTNLVTKHNDNTKRFEATLKDLYGKRSPYAVIDVSRGVSRAPTKSTSLVNHASAGSVTEFLQHLLAGKVPAKDIVILTFYQGQKLLIKEKIAGAATLSPVDFLKVEDVDVLTVDSSPSLEKSIVLLDVVVAYQHSNLSKHLRTGSAVGQMTGSESVRHLKAYARDGNRLNTVITCAKNGLAIFLQKTTMLNVSKAKTEENRAALTLLVEDAVECQCLFADNRHIDKEEEVAV